jgi:hypothetical protein
MDFKKKDYSENETHIQPNIKFTSFLFRRTTASNAPAIGPRLAQS